jgi:hypothetical protein
MLNTVGNHIDLFLASALGVAKLARSTAVAVYL